MIPPFNASGSRASGRSGTMAWVSRIACTRSIATAVWARVLLIFARSCTGLKNFER